MSSRAYLQDLIHSIGEKTALADHIEEQLLSNENPEQNKIILKKLLELRREQMSSMLEQGTKPDPHYWCAWKHAVKAFTLDCEVYEATLSDEDLKKAQDSADILAMLTSQLLGMEFETCARCLYDKMLVSQVEKESSDI